MLQVYNNIIIIYHSYNMQNVNFIGDKRVAFFSERKKSIVCEACEVLVFCPGSSVVRCFICTEYRLILNRMLCRAVKFLKDTDKSSPQSHTNYRYLSSPEKSQRLLRLHQHNRVLQQQIDRLKLRIEKLVDQRGIQVDESLDSDLRGIVQDKTPLIYELYKKGSFARIFWEQQQKAMMLKNAKSMKWDPLMIRWCLYLRHLSSSGYKMVRESGAIKLPSQRTLRDYTYVTETTAGFSANVDQQIMEAANIHECNIIDKYIILIMDEMHNYKGRNRV